VFKIEVLKRAQQMIGEQERIASSINNSDVESRMDFGGMVHDSLLALKIMYVGGIVRSDELANFRRLIIRATRCQVYVHSYEL